VARERQSQISLLGPNRPHEVRAFRHSNEITAPERVFNHTYYHVDFLEGCQLTQLTNVKHDLKGYYTIGREEGDFPSRKFLFHSVAHITSHKVQYC
jgi:hypothetical protein